MFQYPYLILSSGLSVFALAGLILYRQHAKVIILSGVLSTPGAFTTFLFVPEYWDPIRLFGFQLGIEDVLFSFSTGMIAWLITLLLHSRTEIQIDWSAILLRYGKVLGIGVPMIFVMQRTELMVMTQALMGIIIISLALSWRRPRYLPLAASTGIAFAILYSLTLFCLFNFFPGFDAQWTHANLSGYQILGIPFEEVLWATVFGFGWIVAMGYVLDDHCTTSATKMSA